MTAALIKNLKVVILVLLAFGLRVSAARAAEITAVDFNGNIIGQVILTAMEKTSVILPRTVLLLIIIMKLSAELCRRGLQLATIIDRLEKLTVMALSEV